MPHRLEAAASGRARCRACGAKIDKGSLRFGEELEGAYGEGKGTTASVYWFHPGCAADRRPETFAPLVRSLEVPALPERDALLVQADRGNTHPRLQRLAGAERSASGRARCRHCHDPIPAGAWRLRLSAFAPSGFFDPLGFLHPRCAHAYFGTAVEPDRLHRAAPALAPDELQQLLAECQDETR